MREPFRLILSLIYHTTLGIPPFKSPSPHTPPGSFYGEGAREAYREEEGGGGRRLKTRRPNQQRYLFTRAPLKKAVCRRLPSLRDIAQPMSGVTSSYVCTLVEVRRFLHVYVS